MSEAPGKDGLEIAVAPGKNGLESAPASEGRVGETKPETEEKRNIGTWGLENG